MNNWLTRYRGWIIAAIIFGLLQFANIVPRDDTDSATQRSNLRLYTDHGTGCQYVAKFWGSPVPRMNAEGKQVCK